MSRGAEKIRAFTAFLNYTGRPNRPGGGYWIDWADRLCDNKPAGDFTKEEAAAVQDKRIGAKIKYVMSVRNISQGAFADVLGIIGTLNCNLSPRACAPSLHPHLAKKQEESQRDLM